MAGKFEVACVRPDWNKDANIVAMPDARYWYKFTKAGGENAFAEEAKLFTSCFSAGTAKKYNFLRSVHTATGEVKVYRHCKGQEDIFVRKPPSLRVTIHTDQLDATSNEISLSKTDILGCISHSITIWKMKCENEVSDITLRTILSTAKKDLVENEHVTSEGKVFFYLEGRDVTTKPKTILVDKYRNTRQFACIALDCAVTTAQEHSSAHAFGQWVHNVAKVCMCKHSAVYEAPRRASTSRQRLMCKHLYEAPHRANTSRQASFGYRCQYQCQCQACPLPCNGTFRGASKQLSREARKKQFACIALECAVTTAQEHSSAHASLLSFVYFCYTRRSVEPAAGAF